MRGLAVVILLFATLAHASPAAEKLFQDGKKLVAEGKLEEGCDSLRRSNDLEERVGTLLNLGDCEQKRGRVATAWEIYLRMRALATKQKDTRAALADQLAATVAKQLPYMTVKTPATKPAGFVVKRDGKDVAVAEFDHEVPIDPGRYEIEASAAGRLPWKQTSVVAAGEKVVVDVPELAIDPGMQTRTATTTIVTARPGGAAIAPPVIVDDGAARPSIEAPSMLTGKHRLGLGAAIGMSTDGDLIYGGRFAIQIVEFGTGALRAVPTVFYTQFTDPEDEDHEFTLYALGLAIEYVKPIAPTFFIATGIGAGVDLISDNYENPGTEQVWGALRLSPTLRIGKAIDLGLHVQLVKTKDNTVGLAELGVDYFFH